DGAANGGQMSAKLVHAAGFGCEFDERGRGRLRAGAITRESSLGAGLAGAGDFHNIETFARSLLEREIDGAFLRLGRTAADDGDVGLGDVAAGEGFGQERGRRLRARGDDDAGGIAVEAVYEARALAVRFGERGE